MRSNRHPRSLAFTAVCLLLRRSRAVGSLLSIFLASSAFSDCLGFVWKPPSRSPNPCALGIGWFPSTSRTHTHRFLSTRNLVGISDFVLAPQTFQFRALCFGLSSAPQVFTHVMARSPQQCIASIFGSYVISTTGSSLGPLSRRLCGRETFCYHFAMNSAS